ncbi:hypothetical protein BDZ91DRAFT_768524 [Kalaharituber pfeilii]|nr:hypothetical protein BDZ91DRAFT_768524 [Kalaharituber pfeilii]
MDEAGVGVVEEGVWMEGESVIVEMMDGEGDGERSGVIEVRGRWILVEDWFVGLQLARYECIKGGYHLCHQEAGGDHLLSRFRVMVALVHGAVWVVSEPQPRRGVYWVLQRPSAENNSEQDPKSSSLLPSNTTLANHVEEVEKTVPTQEWVKLGREVYAVMERYMVPLLQRGTKGDIDDFRGGLVMGGGFREWGREDWIEGVGKANVVLMTGTNGHHQQRHLHLPTAQRTLIRFKPGCTLSSVIAVTLAVACWTTPRIKLSLDAKLSAEIATWKGQPKRQRGQSRRGWHFQICGALQRWDRGGEGRENRAGGASTVIGIKQGYKQKSEHWIITLNGLLNPV